MGELCLFACDDKNLQSVFLSGRGGANEQPVEGICLKRLEIGGKYDPFLMEPIFKVGFLSLFSIEPLFRYPEI